MCAWDQYEVVGTLGRGQYGVVSRARHRKLGKLVALKSVSSLQMNDESEDSAPQSLGSGDADTELTRQNVPLHNKLSKENAALYHEAKVLAKLNHPSLVSLVEVCVGTNGELVLAMEDLGGMSLTGLVDKHCNGEGLCESLVGCIAGSICNALIYLHSKGFLHRDVKPDNIMVEGNGSCFQQAKLIDFGLSIAFSEQSLPSSSDNRAGTVAFMAPELMSPGVLYGPETDLFSLGATLYFALTGSEPFVAFTTPAGQRSTTSVFGLQAQHEEALEHFKPVTQEMLRQMLNISVKDRCSLDDVVNSKWVSNSLRSCSHFQNFHSDLFQLDSWLTLHYKTIKRNSKCFHCSASPTSSTMPSECGSYDGDTSSFSDTSASSGSSFLKTFSNKSLSLEKELLLSQNSFLPFSGCLCKMLGFQHSLCPNKEPCLCSLRIPLDEDTVRDVAEVLQQDTDTVSSCINENPWGEVAGVYNLLKRSPHDRSWFVGPQDEKKLAIEKWKTDTL